MTQAWPELDPALMAPVAEHEELRLVVRSMLDRTAEHEQVRTAAATEEGYSTQLWRRLIAELDVARLAVPEAVGGHGFGMRELTVVLEEAGAALLPEPILASAVLGCQALATADDPKQVADLLEPALDGELVVTTSFAAGPVTVTGVRDEGGQWRLTGRRRSVLEAGAADLVVLDAATPQGKELFVVRATDMQVVPRSTIDLTRRQGDLLLEGAPARLVVGADRADSVVERLALVGRAACAAEHAGMVGELLARTCEYVGQRAQFGRPIGSFQAVKHRLADVLVDQERSRSAVRYAAVALDVEPDTAALAVEVAAAVCSDAVMRTAHEAIQLHGGIGFTWEHRAHYYLRRALGDEGLFGPAREHRARIADLVGV